MLQETETSEIEREHKTISSGYAFDSANRVSCADMHESIAGFDIGGIYIKASILREDALVQMDEIPANAQKGARAMLEQIALLAQKMPGVTRIGISTAGEVDALSGAIRFFSNIPGYTGMNPREMLERMLGLPVWVENDVNAAAVGEYAFGAARGYTDFVMLSYGTGVGGAIFAGGKLYRGSGCSAGEFGGMLIHPEAIRKDQQGSGSYERYASTAALVSRVQRRFPKLNTGREIFLHMDDSEIKKEIDDWICEVAYGIISVVHSFDPALVVLGGGIMQQPYIIARLNQILKPMRKPSFQACRIVPALLGNRAGLMGAGWLAGKRL